MPKRPRSSGTSTSTFGSPGRVNHDASPFYESRLYADLPQEEKVEYIENPIPSERLNTIVCRSSEEMNDLPDCSVHLVVTSPPYNVGKEYDADLSLAEYRDMLRRVWKEVYRVLVPGGRACINVANLGRKPYLPLHAFLIADLLELGFLMRGEIIWNKASSGSSSTAWGSWLSARNPVLRDAHEYVLVFSRQMYARESTGRTSTLTREEFLEYTRSVWTLPAVQAKSIGHPAPFPVELPRRLVQLYTFSGDVVMDPFMGSGQTAIAALETGRQFVGYEINPEYVALAQQRIAHAGREKSK